jgi:quinol monooxygenase YgiN
VNVRIKPELVSDFLVATLENARLSVQEPGIARFDVLQDKTRPDVFVLNEVYRTADAPAQHKTTTHYQKWRDAVADMMAEPRSSVQFTNLFPADEAF